MIQISENIVKIIEKAGLKILFIGSDSDPAYNEKKEEFFSEILDKIFPINDFSELEFKQNSINFYVHQFSFDKVYWCDDGSHILKRMRTRLVNYKVLYLIPGASSYVDINFFLQYCSDVMSKKALDTRSICSMDDWYPAQIYSSEIFFGAIESKNWSLVLYLSPPVALNLILRAKNLTREDRLFICYFGLFSMLNIYSQIKITERSKKIDGVYTFYTKQQVFTYCDHIVAHLTMLHQNKFEYSMNRIGSMCLENFNSQIRYFSHSDHTYKTFEEAIDKICIMLSTTIDYEPKIRNRWYDFGIADDNYNEPDESLIIGIIGLTVKISKLADSVFSLESPLYKIQTYEFNQNLVEQIQNKIFALMCEEAIVNPYIVCSSIFREQHQKSFHDMCVKGRMIRARNLTS